VLEKQKIILLTFDVEDWFQVENFKEYIPFSTWDSFQLRVEKNVHRLLDLLDSFPFKPEATFFILGWIAKRLPHLIIEIQNRGHEVASHGHKHQLCTNQTFRQLEQDLLTGKKRLEDIISAPVLGYRAPSFAINDEILKTINATGHRYDSSFNSFSMHGRYGKISLPEKQTNKSCYEIDKKFYEIPISNLHLGNKVVPLGGGGYFRLFPLTAFLCGMRQILNKQDVFTFYSHPWEFDPEQPRVEQASKFFKFRHYVNQTKAEKKLTMMIEKFSYCRFLSCRKYVETLVNQA